MRELLGRFAADEAGTAAIEYAGLAILFGLGVLLALDGIGVTVEGTFTALSAAFVGSR